MKRKWAYQAGCATVALLAMSESAAAAGIATVTEVVNEGYRTPPGADELSAKTADELVRDEALRTEAESLIQVKFIDGSELTVEQSSEVVLDDYIFSNGASKGTLDLKNGLFHFTSNGSEDQGVTLRTPVATIGVRGTEFLVHVDGDNATIIDILSGAVEAVPRGAGAGTTCVGGQSILIATGNDNAQCGDIGSFSTAAAPPSNAPASGEGAGNGDKAAAQASRPEPEPDSDPDPGCERGDGGGAL